VDHDVAVAQQVVGAALDRHAEVAVPGGVGLLDEAVGQLVADQRLGRVDQVGDQRLGRGRAGWDRPVVGVDELDDGEVARQDDGRVVRVAAAEDTLGRAELVDHADAERGGDAGARIGQELLAAAGDGQRRDPHPTGWKRPEAEQPGEAVAAQPHGVVDDRVGPVGEHAALTGAAAGGQHHILAQQRRRLGAAAGEVPLEDRARQPGVGEQVVEAGHHLGLGHGRQRGQVGELEPRRVDAGQALGVDRERDFACRSSARSRSR
jgi:hypothetical protein